jgi:type I restriction enzyme M protein
VTEGPESEPLMTAKEIGQALGMTGAMVTNWVRRKPDFPPGRVDAGRRKRYSVAEVALWLDRQPIQQNQRMPGEDPEFTLGHRFRRTLGLGFAPGTSLSPVPHDRAGVTQPGPPVSSRPVAEIDPWAGLMRALGTGDKATQLDVVTALLWLRSADSTRSLVALSHGGRIPAAVRERWDGVGRLFPGPAPAPIDAFANSWWQGRLSKIAEALDQAMSASRHVARIGESTATSVAVVFEAVLDRLAQDRHQGLGWYLTPTGVAQTMVRLMDPRPGEKVIDPCCGYGELLVAAGRHVVATGEAEVRLHGLAQDERAWRITAMNAAVHDLPVRVGPESDQLLRLFPEQMVSGDVVVTNPPFSRENWTESDPASRSGWPYGPPPRHNSRFAWLQVVVASLTPSGRGAVIMPTGTAEPNHTWEREILRGMIEDGVVRCVIDLPGRLFRETTVPVSIWVLGPPNAGSRGGVLVIDAASAVSRQTSTHWIMTPAGQDRIVTAWSRWSADDGTLEAEPGFSAMPTLEQIRDQGYVLAPARYLEPAQPTRQGGVPEGAMDDHQVLTGLQHDLAQIHEQAKELDESLDKYLARLVRRSSP